MKMSEKLTGEYYFKSTLFGLVLYVEIWYYKRTLSGYNYTTKFRKAKMSDNISFIKPKK